MQRAVFLAVFGLLLVGAEGAVRPTPGACAYCPTYTCYSSRMCGRNCFCMKRGGEQGGDCYSVDALPPEGALKLR